MPPWDRLLNSVRPGAGGGARTGSRSLIQRRWPFGRTEPRAGAAIFGGKLAPETAREMVEATEWLDHRLLLSGGAAVAEGKPPAPGARFPGVTLHAYLSEQVGSTAALSRAKVLAAYSRYGWRSMKRCARLRSLARWRRVRPLARCHRPRLAAEQIRLRCPSASGATGCAIISCSDCAAAAGGKNARTKSARSCWRRLVTVIERRQWEHAHATARRLDDPQLAACVEESGRRRWCRQNVAGEVAG